MELYEPKKLKDKIILLLKDGPKTTLDLLDYFNKTKPSFTKQAVYPALKELKDSGVITVTKGLVSLYSRWLDDLADYVTIAKYNTQGISVQKSFLDLQENERIEYYFNSAQETEMFWAHVFGLLLDIVKPESDLYTYVPHDWFMLMSRVHSEEWQIRKAYENKIHYLATAGNNTPLDKEAKRLAMKLPGMQAHNLDKPLFNKNTYYVNIFGEFLIEVYIDKTTANRIESFFNTYEKMSDEALKELDFILQNRGKNRIVVSRNKKKVDNIIPKLRKYFK